MYRILNNFRCAYRKAPICNNDLSLEMIMNNEQYLRKIEELKANVLVLNEQIALFERLVELDNSVGAPSGVVSQTASASGADSASVPVRPFHAVKKRGRRPGTNNTNNVAKDSDGKKANLGDLLQSICKTSNKPLKIDELTILVRESGYASKSKDFGNMVYQAVRKLVEAGVLTKNEDRSYSL